MGHISKLVSLLILTTAISVSGATKKPVKKKAKPAATAVKPKPAPAPAPVPALPPEDYSNDPMPIAPLWAAPSTKLPARGADGVWNTPNRRLSFEESVWNFRAAMNVAALTCKGGDYDVIASNYNQMLETHRARLAQANSRVDGEYQSRNPGNAGLRVRDTQSSVIYNYFGFPPLHWDFCDLALVKSKEVIATPAAAFADYAIKGLADVDAQHLKFFDDFEKYQQDMAAWTQRHPNAFPPKPAKKPVKKTVKKKKK